MIDELYKNIDIKELLERLLLVNGVASFRVRRIIILNKR